MKSLIDKIVIDTRTSSMPHAPWPPESQPKDCALRQLNAETWGVRGLQAEAQVTARNQGFKISIIYYATDTPKGFKDILCHATFDAETWKGVEKCIADRMKPAVV